MSHVKSSYTQVRNRMGGEQNPAFRFLSVLIFCRLLHNLSYINKRL